MGGESQSEQELEQQEEEQEEELEEEKKAELQHASQEQLSLIRREFGGGPVTSTSANTPQANNAGPRQGIGLLGGRKSLLG